MKPDKFLAYQPSNFDHVTDLKKADIENGLKVTQRILIKFERNYLHHIFLFVSNVSLTRELVGGFSHRKGDLESNHGRTLLTRW